MAGAIGLESFVSAIACLCASSFGPSPSNPSVTNVESRMFGALSRMDLGLLQILVNSKTKFSIQNTNSECALPHPENIGERLNILEKDIKHQRDFSERLEMHLKNLSKNSASKSDCKQKDTEIESLRQIIATLETKKQQKDAEIESLRQKIATLETKKQPLSKNFCLSNKQGFTNMPHLWSFKIFCDQKLDKKYGRGWMLMAQRFNGNEHFFRKWDSYVKGFGTFDASKEFFVGLEILSNFTNKYPNELLFVLIDRDNVERYAHYDLFVIGSEKEKFALKSLGKYTGDAGDSLRYHVGQMFSTWDDDNDESLEHCAAKHSGAWWYKNCHESNLFGIYNPKRNSKNKRNGMIWSTFHDTSGGYLSSMRMYIKAKED